MESEFDLFKSNLTLEGSIVGIGTFDGVHLGHRSLVDRVLDRARSTGYPGVILTFDPHPKDILLGKPQPRLGEILTTVSLLAPCGLDHMIVIRFTPEFSTWHPLTFVRDVLVNRLQAREVVVGFNFTFGAGGAGTPQTLNELGRSHGFKVHTLDPVRLDGELVSSSAIRRLITAGDVRTAARFLNRPYSIMAPVISGEGRGRQIGFPTANLDVDSERIILPAQGVYRGQARVRDQETMFPCLVNIGINPTFVDRSAPPLKVEVHLIGFSDELVGAPLTVLFEERLRDEKKFPDKEALVAQIRRDLESVIS